MDFFDLRTAYLITGMLYFIMPAAVWLALKEARSASVNEWCTGGGLFGASLFLLGLRGELAPWITYELMTVLMNAGLLARISALRRQLRRPWHWRAPVGLLVLFFVCYEFARWQKLEGLPYYLVSLIFMVAYFSWLSMLAWQLAEQERLTSAYWLSATYLPGACLLFLQMVKLGLGQSELHPMSSDLLVITMAMGGTLTAVISNTSFLGIFVERATRQKLEMAQTEAQAVERGRLRRKIIHLERVRSMGMLSTVLAHELSQPLSSIQLTAEQAEAEAESDAVSGDRRLRQLRTIVSQSRHARDILQRIRSFISPHPTPHTPVSLQEVNAQVLALLKEWLQAERVGIELRQPTAPVMVSGDAVQLAQVLVNIYRNAIEACAAQPAATVITTTIEQQSERAILRIQDNGAGFSTEALQKNHEGFFSSKHDGLGLGLLISRDIAAQHQGQLHVGNAEGGGALVTLELPSWRPGPALAQDS